MWSTQLRVSDFPPVCAMTGAPAGTSYKFRFATTPASAQVFDVVTGGLFGATYFSSRGRTASGRLPLSFRARRRLRMSTWIPLSTIPLSLLLVATASFLPSSVAGATGIFGIVLVTAGLVGFLVARPLIGPKAKVIRRQPGWDDSLVELRNVHPAFVAAVNQMHADRARQHSSPQPGPDLSLTPGSN